MPIRRLVERLRSARLHRLAAAFGLVASIACGGSEGAERESAPVPAVEAVQARFGGLPLRERLTGSVQASGQVAIYPEATGPVVEVLADNGDFVRRGDPLVRIEPRGTIPQLAQARASIGVARAEAAQARSRLEELEAQLERTETLAEEQLVSQETLEAHRAQVAEARATHQAALAQVESARASVSERQEMVGQTVVRAPISGRVGQRNVEVGMRVDGQTPLFTIGRLEEMRVEVPVTQEMLAHIREGQAVELTSESLPDTVITATVSRISPFLEPGSFSAEVEIDVSNEEGTLMPGMFVTVEILYGESERATLVPKSALYENPATGQQGVYEIVPPDSIRLEVPEAGQRASLSEPLPARFRPVQVLAEGREMVGVDGVDRDAWVAVVGQHLLSGQGETEAASEARVRPVSWDHVLELQGLQRQDLLRQFMEKQQELGRQLADSIAAPADTSSR